MRCGRRYGKPRARWGNGVQVCNGRLDPIKTIGGDVMAYSCSLCHALVGAGRITADYGEGHTPSAEWRREMRERSRARAVLGRVP